MNFQENPSNRSRDGSPRKVSLIIDQQQSKFRVLWRMPEVRSTNCEENSSNESQDTAEKELSSPNEVPLVSNRSQ
jgi:hypothetical protein